jgi:transposase
VSCQAACNWLELWERGGTKALTIADRTGRFAKITDKQLAAVEAILLQGARASGYTTEIWTLQRVGEVIMKTTRVTYHPGQSGATRRRTRRSGDRPVGQSPPARNQTGARRRRAWIVFEDERGSA